MRAMRNHTRTHDTQRLCVLIWLHICFSTDYFVCLGFCFLLTEDDVPPELPVVVECVFINL
jgi:hypothetical protein